MLRGCSWNTPKSVSPIVSGCVTYAGFCISDVSFNLDSQNHALWILQVQVRNKEEQCCGAVWDCLPICEKEKDEINFSNFGPEVWKLIFTHFILIDIVQKNSLQILINFKTKSVHPVLVVAILNSPSKLFLYNFDGLSHFQGYLKN